MQKRLFLLDGMALVYRAHFAMIRNPIMTSAGVNTSALYGFTTTLLHILEGRDPTHLAIAFDTPEPTFRHKQFEAYKAQREAMPEDISAALEPVRRMAAAFNVPVLTAPGFEADDIIGTLATRAAKEDFETYMVTPDKDFGQLVSDHVFILKPGRGGDQYEILGVDEILARWGVESPDQVIDILGLMGDASDNIPGVKGVGEKTAAKLIGQYGSVENLLAHTDELKGKQKERLEEQAEQARLSKALATITREVPLEAKLDDLAVQSFDKEALAGMFSEFEFNTLGKRVLGKDFKAGRGSALAAAQGSEVASDGAQGLLFAEPTTASNTPHTYHVVKTARARRELAAQLADLAAFCFDTETTGLNPLVAELVGLSFAWEKGTAYYVPVPEEATKREKVLDDFRAVFASGRSEKVGHHLKFDLKVLAQHGCSVGGKLFDTMLAHCLVEPDQRHAMDYVAEAYLGYTPIPITRLIGEKKGEQISLREVPPAKLAEYAAEDADITWQLREKLQPLLGERNQDHVFYEIEIPLVPVLAAVEREGIRIDAEALALFSERLAQAMAELEQRIYKLAGTQFNLNSPKQLGEVLFDILQLEENAKKTRTGQYATDEQVLSRLAVHHEIARCILKFREASKLKNTYVDTLPATVLPSTGRVHTTFSQLATATGRLASQNPNLQNIPIRTEQGQEIRKAFVARDGDHELLSADYSQIELRIIASLSEDPGMMEAFAQALDIHAATAARIHGVAVDEVEPEMRRQAKMVNYGLMYGMSAFGLAQRLAIPRGEANAIMESYFAQFPGVRDYLDRTIAAARDNGYVETMTGRRRYLRDINSRNGTIRMAAERVAVNMPVQGTGADMIKMAMTRIASALQEAALASRLVLQVHDELLLDVPKDELERVKSMVEQCMVEALPLKVPVEVDMGHGRTWLEAH